MAEQLEEFEWNSRRKGTSRYDQYMDGSIWKLDHRTDSGATSTAGLRTSLIATAKRLNLSCRTQTVDKHYVVFQVIDKEE